MARSITISVLCDRCSSIATDDHPDVRFSYRGTDYHIDLCDRCAKELDEQLRPFVAVAETAAMRARRTSRERVANGVSYLDHLAPVKARTTNASRTAELAAMRTWAKENGHGIATRGRVPATVEAAWRASLA